MTLPSWHHLLPEIPLADGFGGKRRDDREFFAVDRGTPKVHRGQRTRSWEQQISQLFTQRELNIFEDWYELDLGGGTSFWWYTDPRRKETGLYLFDEGGYSFRYANVVDDEDEPVWVVSFKLLRVK